MYVFVGKANKTNEQKAIINLLRAFDQKWLINKVNTQPALFEEVLNKLSTEWAMQYIQTLGAIVSDSWTENEKTQAPYVSLEVIDAKDCKKSEVLAALFSQCTLDYDYLASCSPTQTGKYEFGFSCGCYLHNICVTSNCYNMKSVKALAPVALEVNNSMLLLPAIGVKYLMIKKFEEYKSELLSLHASFLMPELFLTRNTTVFKIFNRAKGAKGGKVFNASHLDDYLKTIPTRNPSGAVGSAPRVYQERVVGALEYEIKTESGIKVWADGIEKKTGTVLEAKYVSDPSSSPFIEGSSCYPPVRQKILDEVTDEFRRYGEIIKDSNTPLMEIEVFTNNSDAVPYFQKLINDFNIPGKVTVKP